MLRNLANGHVSLLLPPVHRTRNIQTLSLPKFCLNPYGDIRLYTVDAWIGAFEPSDESHLTTQVISLEVDIVDENGPTVIQLPEYGSEWNAEPIIPPEDAGNTWGYAGNAPPPQNACTKYWSRGGLSSGKSLL